MIKLPRDELDFLKRGGDDIINESKKEGSYIFSIIQSVINKNNLQHQY